MSDVVRVLFSLTSIRFALVLGGLVDLLFGALPLWFRPSWMTTWMDFPVAGELQFWPRYAAIFLLVLPAFYFVTAIDPEQYRANVFASVWGRALGCWFYAKYYAKFPEHHHRRLLLAMAVMNGVFALYYLSYLSASAGTGS